MMREYRCGSRPRAVGEGPEDRETPQSVRQVGHAGPPGRMATEALSKDIIVDMFAHRLQGVAPEDAVKCAAVELRKIYGA